MTPTNTAITPEIENIADENGDKHTVIPTPHTHLMSEVTGLLSALVGKSDTNHTHKLLQYNPSSSHDGFAGFLASENGDFTIGVQESKSISLMFGAYVKAIITNTNVDNLARALQNPDTTPTAWSDKLVTSGGVKAALDAKRQIRQDDSETLDHAIVSATAEDGDVYILLSVREGDNTMYVHITPDNMDNLIRALREPNTEPVTDSDDLITSGAVAAALRNATRMRQSIEIPEFSVIALEKGIVYDYIFTNNSGESISLISCFDTSALPVSERNLYVTENGDGVTINDGDKFGVRICRLDEGVFVEYLGLFV